MLSDEVPYALCLRCGLRVALVSIEDLQQVVKDAFLNVVRLEAGLLIVCQEGQTVLDQQLGRPCYHLNYTKLSYVIQLRLPIPLSKDFSHLLSSKHGPATSY